MQFPFPVLCSVAGSLFFFPVHVAADCSVYARTDGPHMLTAHMKSRRRVVYDTNKVLPNYDPEMWGYGWQWAGWKDECGASTDNMQVYYHGAVVRLGAYVIDSNEDLGSNGDAAHDCLLEKFRGLLVEKLNCTLTEGFVLDIQGK